MNIAVSPARWLGLDDLRPTLRSFLRTRCPDRSELEDVLHETLLRAARYRHSLADPRNLSGWTHSIAVNVVRDRARRLRRQERMESGNQLFDGLIGREPIPGEEDHDDLLRFGPLVVERAVALRELEAALLELKPADREVLESYYHDERSCGETADMCGIPSPLVKVRLYRARQRLMRTLRRRLRPTTTSGCLDAAILFGGRRAGVA
ncbi:MAG: RNA polymerase sigma factor [Planctomycetes bacterium]|nr:RNA polymerase sigma factor [Planctomycetota bacterium]